MTGSTSASQTGAISPSLSVNPSIVRQTVQPNKVTTIKISLTNSGVDPIPLSAGKLDITGINNQGSPEFSTQIGPRSAATWLTVSPADVILAPSETKQIAVTITPPANIAPGGYQAALIFQANLPSYYFDLDANARILPALATSFILTVPTDNLPTVADLKIESLKLPKVVVSGPVPVVAQVHNPTNFFIFTDGQIGLKPTFGSEQKVTTLDKSIIFPDSTREYVSASSNRLIPSIYTATMSLNQGDKVLVASAKFFALPWSFIVGTILILFVLIFLIARRRLRRAWAVLAHGHNENLTNLTNTNKKIKPIIRQDLDNTNTNPHSKVNKYVYQKVHG